MRAKYIVWSERSGLMRVEIFDSIVTHIDRARALGITDRIESAGEFSIGVEEDDTPKAFAFGRSVTLGVTSCSKDGELIDQLLRIGRYHGN